MLCRSIYEMVIDEVVPMGMEADNICVHALVAALPVRLKVLEAAGSWAYVGTFGPEASNACSATAGASGAFDTTSSSGVENTSANSALHRGAAPAADALQIWLIHEVGHYEVVYPAQAYQNMEELPDIEGIVRRVQLESRADCPS